jgi:hypothetical protein
MLKDYVEHLDFNFRNQQNPSGLLAEYNSKLDPNFNSEIKKDFVLIPREDNIYFGQVSSENLKHGIGTLLFDNDFSYQGMFENDKMTGIGISEDAYMVKYIGEHKDGKRDGRGILQMPDGREYEGTWRENRMHGRGQERMPNG